MNKFYYKIGWRNNKPVCNINMTKQQYIELTGEDPEDMFGEDWQNYLDDFNKVNKRQAKKERDQDFDALMDLVK